MQKEMKVRDSIGVFDNFIQPEVCKQLIKNYEADVKKNLAYTREGEGALKQNKEDTSVDYYFNNNWNATNTIVCDAVKEALDLYEKKTNFLKFCGINEVHFNGIKIQKTLPGQGYHVWHIEKDLPKNCPRVLVYSVYLNTINEGGETEFLLQNQRLEPVEGRICIFPAYYPYIHRGNPPLQGEKYLLTSWFRS